MPLKRIWLNINSAGCQLCLLWGCGACCIFYIAHTLDVVGIDAFTAVWHPGKKLQFFTSELISLEKHNHKVWGWVEKPRSHPHLLHHGWSWSCMLSDVKKNMSQRCGLSVLVFEWCQIWPTAFHLQKNKAMKLEIWAKAVHISKQLWWYTQKKNVSVLTESWDSYDTSKRGTESSKTIAYMDIHSYLIIHCME